MDNKHYVTIEDGLIVAGFSDAFRVPEVTDICINENGGRHFTMDGMTNPSLKDEDGYPLYTEAQVKLTGKPSAFHKWVGGEWVEDTKKAKKAALDATDATLSRTEEDLADAIVANGGTLSTELQDKVTAKKAARAAYLAEG